MVNLMDRNLTKGEIRKRKMQMIYKWVAGIAAGSAIFIAAASVLRQGVDLADLSASTVDRGVIEISIAATGKVVPFTEEVIASPLPSKILEVYKKAGDSIGAGEPILRLDLTTISADIGKLDDELEMKRCKLEQLQKATESVLEDMQVQLEIDRMKLRRMEVVLKNEIFLDSIGASTSDKIRQAELEYDVNKLQLKQLELKLQNQQRTAEADLKVMKLEYRIALKNAMLQNKMMQEAQVRSPRSATLTWVNDQVGTSVSSGMQLAIVSDLSRYKVEAEIADSYANKILSGSAATAVVGGKKLKGTVENVAPSVKNGMISFSVLLEDSSDKILRSGLKVDVYVINALRENVLRIANNSYYVGEGEYHLWTLQGDKIVKRKVALGESSYSYVEVKDGLSEGELVITSDMNKYGEKNVLKIK
jgi:HlyD family secretion protein